MKGKKNQICRNYETYGKCQYGDKCYFLHIEPEDKKEEKEKKEKNDKKEKKINLSKIKEKFGGYGQNIKFIVTQEEYATDINNIIKLNDNRYLTSDSNEFHISEIKENEKDEYIYKSEYRPNAKFGKMIFSSQKLIFTESINDANEEKKKYFLKIFYNNTFSFCEIKKEPFNILESDDIIIVIEEKIIELFKFENLKSLIKISEIEVDDQILSIEKTNKLLFCGHKSGIISIWSPISETPFLKNIRTFKIHYNSINKIICNTKKEDDKIILITGSSDKTLKVHSLENKDRICIHVINFIDELIDIQIVKNGYIVSLKNGILKILDSSFKEIYEIPSRFKTQKTRYVLEIENKDKDNHKGDFLFITEGGKLEKFYWNKNNNNKE